MNKISVNYCLVKKNEFHTEIMDMLDEEGLSMNRSDDRQKIDYEIDKIINNAKYLTISKEFDNNNNMLENMTENVLDYTENANNTYERHADNILISRDHNVKYTIFYFLKKNDDENKQQNDLCTLLNIETIAIYDTCGILKIKKDNDGKLINGDIISKNDIKNLVKMLYYHKGLMIDSAGKMTEIEYFGDNVVYTIGNTFSENGKHKELYDKVVVYYEEKNTSTEKNLVASELLGEIVYGRIFIIMLSDNSNKFWNFTIETAKEICGLKSDGINEDDHNLSKIYST
jgi:hypothetical protein